mmetsp:Transcript_40664/g.102942  ORF Transcript_40664/g.102942 Transcript_40664/m.102942 type:complete len:285 (+) Transcript_40664:221-1075(+)
MAAGGGASRGVLQSMACLAIIFSLSSVVLYFCATGLTSWSVAVEPAGQANGELGIYHLCPNTAYFTNDTVMGLLNITSVPTACVYVDYYCNVALGTATATPYGTAYTVRVYNIFNPRAYNFDDRIYQLIKVFPGPGSCSAYQNARVWAGLASFGALFGFLTAPFGLCAPSRRRSGGSSGSGCVCCAVVCGIVSLCVWAASVINWSTSEYGSAYWCMLCAVVLGAASIPCLGAFALAPSSDPAYAHHPPPNAPPVGSQYPPPYTPQYYPQQPPPADQQYQPRPPA